MTVQNVKGKSTKSSHLRCFSHFPQVVGLALAIPNALITIIRLGIRARAWNLGLDDAFAASSLVSLLVFYVAMFLHFDPNRGPLLLSYRRHTSTGLSFC